jgi:MSHA biogenesis protein MshI
MKWPSFSAPLRGVIALRRDGNTLSWVHAEGEPGRPGRVLACGEASTLGEAGASAAQRLKALAPKQVLAVLPLHAAQLLLIEAPAVPPEELRAAARWRIKDMVEGVLDDYTVDVMAVGDGQERGTRHLFVAAATNARVRELSELAQDAGLPLSVIDIVEAAQRNLQTAAASAAGLQARATAALLRHGEHCLLTLCVDGELFEARRLDAALLDAAQAAPTTAAGALAEDPAAPLPDDWHYVDYGAQPEAEHHDAGHERLLLELQRSFDVWERSHPGHPLAALWLHVGAESAALSLQLGRTLGLRVEVLDALTLFPGLEEAAPDAALRESALPLLGALLRSETRQA